MKSVVPYIVYPWLIVSIVVYVRRAVNRRAAASDPTAPPATPATAPTPRSPLRPASRPAPPAQAPAAAVPHVPKAPPADLPLAPPVVAPDGTVRVDATHYPLEPAVAAALQEEGRIPADDATATATATPGRAGLFAKASDAGEPRAPLASLLSGIALPCDLAPLVTADDADVTDRHVCFWTSGHDAAEVGGALGDELERLGFSLATLTEASLRASRDDGALVVTIHPEPHTVVGDDGARSFPTTSDGDVVVEFTSA